LKRAVGSSKSQVDINAHPLPRPIRFRPMRKISPQSIIDDFVEQLGDIKDLYVEGIGALSHDGGKSRLAEYSLLAAAVAWEGFISDILIAYINKDSARFKQHLRNSFDEHLKEHDKAKTVFSKYGKIELPSHLSKADVQSLANISGSNITFSSFALLEERARAWLVQPHAEKFIVITPSQKGVVNAVIALRNHIAHRSKRSLDAMNDALAEGALYTTGLKRQDNKFHNVGAWLKAKPVGRSESRLITIISILETIGSAC
jgi:hypothetical protein